ncbi:MAG TPA: C40 family peptidase [Actinomycetota bacterium]|nr:C40 family peptidase [Actinomycetota bacterium]
MAYKHAYSTRAAAALCVALGTLAATVPSAQAHSHEEWRQQRAHVEDRARSVRGTRYSYGGSSPRSGFDCSGFTRWVFQEHGANLPHSSIDQFYLAGRNGHKRVWQIKNLQPGDLVFFKTTSRRIGHAGIFIGDGKFIHSSSAGGGVKISSISDPYYYKPRFVGATRLAVTQKD